MAARGFSFKDLSERSDLADFEWDDEDEDKKPKKNPFDFGESDVSFDTSAFELSKKEIKEFLNTSRGITYTNDNDDSLGEPWGGAQYSLKTEKPTEAPKSARFRSESFENQHLPQSTKSKPSSTPLQRSSGVPAKVQPARPPPVSSQLTSNKNTSSTSPFPAKSTTTSKSSSLNAGLIRDKTGSTSSPNDKKTSLKTVSLSISEVIATAPQVSANEYSRLQTEVGQLRRDLQAAKHSRLKPLPVEESVKRIVRGQPYSLELHKSLQDKVNLLNCALKSHDGNAIIAFSYLHKGSFILCLPIALLVILFLKRTVKNGIFIKELCKSQKAVDHYCKYLQQHYDFNELAQLYRIIGRHEEAAIVKFKQAVKASDPSLVLHSLKDVYRNDISLFQSVSPELSSAVLDYTKLLEMQISLESADSRAEQEKRNHVMVSHPRQATIPLLPVITTLFYCCMYHYAEPETIQSSPLSLRSTFKISEKQYEWTALAACAKIKRWKEIDDVLKGKGWFGTSKNRSLIGFERVATLLFQGKAPVEVVAKYLRLVDDPSKRLSLATKCKSHDVVIETLVLMKDRQRLDQYREQLPNHAPQHQTISNYLRNSQIRWKN